MNSNYTELFRFQSVSMPEDLFHVIRFRGTEGLNTLFSFTIDLVSSKVDVDTTAMLRNPGMFTINRKDGSRAVFSGYPSEVTQSGHFNGYTYYSVVLRPTFWKLCGVVQSRIFLNKNVKDTVSELLHEQPYFSFPHEFRLGQTSYPVPEFAMQYEENVYDYICWRLEEQGITWHTEQSGNSDMLVFSDTPHLYSALPQTPPLRYSPPSGMQVDRDEELITAFNLSSHPLPQQVVIRTYNWQNPNKPVTGKAQISAEGLGDVYLTTEAVENDAEAGRLAAIRAEALRCRGRLFSGTSAVPAMRPGFVFTLEGHYNPAFNREYFLTEVTHEGSQEAFLTLGLGIPLHDAKEHFFYHNSFVCIESDVQYRPPRTAPRTAVHGVVHAFIDGAGSGARPELDEFGRYKVLFPFDISGRQKGNASCWLRMAQPQVGNNSGLSFPLLPGTEVTVAFQDGNPDRPVITGALSNGETGSLTRNTNVNTTGMRTAGGNQIVFNDEDTKQAIHLRTPSGRGLSMSAGSLDSASMTTDAWLKTASTMSADISGLGHTFFGGFKNSQFVSNDDKHAMLSGIATMGTSMISSIFTTLAETVDEGCSYGADVAKILNLALQAGVNFHDVTDSHKHGYSSIVRATQHSTLSEIKVKPEKAQIVAGIVLSVTAQATKLAVEAANAGLANDSDDQYSWDSKDTDYYESRKTAAIHDILTSSAADLIPEILTYILMSKLLSGSDPTGGVLQEALENNISLVAKGPVGIHTLSGILLNTAFTKTGSESINTPKPNKPAPLKKLDDFIDEVAAVAPTTTNVTTPVTTPAPPNATSWGTNGNALKQQRAFNDLMQDQDELKYTSPATPNNPTDPGKTYVALLTELLFEYAKYRKSITEEVHSQQAKTHWLSTLDGASSIKLRTEEATNPQVNPGIITQVTKKNSTDKHEILQVLNLDSAGAANRSFLMSEKGFTLEAKNKTDNSNIFGQDGDLTLTTKQGSNEAAILLGNAGITLTFNKKGIELNEKGASIAKDGEVDVAGVHFKKSKITVAEGSKLTVGGELEIINSGSSFNVSGLNKQLTDLLKKVDDNRADLDKTMDELRKLKDVPPEITVPPTTSIPSAPGAPSVAAVTPTP